MRIRFLVIAILFFGPLYAQKLDMNLFHGMQPRNIGPAGMSGRVTAVDVNLSNPDQIFVGTASGGLWMSEGGGVSWKPIFDSMEVASIGAVAIDQSNPDVIWVGTGEGNPRNSQSSGGGIYKSIDGGRTWMLMGLQRTRNIHRIIVHRDNPNIVYVAAIGYAWGDSADRGVYRTTDGGKNWEKVLFVNNRTGAADFVVDPTNPNKMFVNMWEYRRWPWFFKSGGPGSGLYVTLDGGDTWTKRTEKDGLPKGELGKIGLAIAPSSPNVVYALVEAEKNGLYRSSDGGFTWTKVNDKDIGDRPFYYSDIAVDPENENRLYNVFSNVKVSQDGGKTFETLLGWDNVHGDHHYWWISPDDPSYMIDGNDGGMAITRDKGASWQFIENLPVGQFYHIAVDNDYPYNVYGGMQDNGTWQGPGSVWRRGGIRNGYWNEITFGDGFDVVIDRNNPNIAYTMYQGGNLFKVDLTTGAAQLIKPVHPEGEYLRFNWNAGIAQGALVPNTLYYGSQYLHASDDGGRSWRIISPDLTTNDPAKQKQLESGGLTLDVTGAENYTTITCIAPSSRVKEVIWVGTDDGNIQLTSDGGKSWTNVGRNIRGLPQGGWVAQIHASRVNSSEAYVVVNNYRQDDWTPYLFRTRDLGVTWERVASQSSVDGYCLSFVQDVYEPRLLFLGTEFGLYVSVDEGANWTKWTQGYPTVSTMDMVIHPREQDLVIATFGRSIFILDDIRPLRNMAQIGASKVLNSGLFVFPGPTAYQAHYMQAPGTRFTGNSIFKGDNRPGGAMITFYVKEITKKDKDGKAAESDTLNVEIKDMNGAVVRQLRVGAKKGVNRFQWNTRKDGVRFPYQREPKDDDMPPPAGRYVLPGEYWVRINYGDLADSIKLKVEGDPRMEFDQSGVEAQYAYYDDLEKYIYLTTRAIDKLRESKSRLCELMKAVNQQVEDKDLKKSVADKSKTVEERIKVLTEMVLSPEDIQGIYRDPMALGSRLMAARSYFEVTPGYFGPTPNQRTAVEAAKTDVLNYVQEVNIFLAGDWINFETEIDSLYLDFTRTIEPVSFD
ncbi:MAG: hypothetical protein KDC34_03050 [Saprospiraceae bacterium]|nr:hypothetical protein [Saprospiraceae bacterium]